MIENCMQAYVVEGPVTGDITDVAGFELKQSPDSCTLYATATILPCHAHINLDWEVNFLLWLQ